MILFSWRPTSLQHDMDSCWLWLPSSMVCQALQIIKKFSLFKAFVLVESLAALAVTEAALKASVSVVVVAMVIGGAYIHWCVCWVCHGCCGCFSEWEGMWQDGSVLFSSIDGNRVGARKILLSILMLFTSGGVFFSQTQVVTKTLFMLVWNGYWYIHLSKIKKMNIIFVSNCSCNSLWTVLDFAEDKPKYFGGDFHYYQTKMSLSWIFHNNSATLVADVVWKMGVMTTTTQLHSHSGFFDDSHEWWVAKKIVHITKTCSPSNGQIWLKWLWNLKVHNFTSLLDIKNFIQFYFWHFYYLLWCCCLVFRAN